MGLLKHLDSDVFGLSSGWSVDFLHAVPTDSPPLQVPFTGAGTYVFLLDTGIRHTHEAVIGRVSTQYSRNYVDGTKTPWDDGGHGTHVASVVSSVAPKATLVSSKVMNSQGRVYGHTLLAAVDDILTNHVPSIRSGDSGGCAAGGRSSCQQVTWTVLRVGPLRPLKIGRASCRERV